MKSFKINILSSKKKIAEKIKLNHLEGQKKIIEFWESKKNYYLTQQKEEKQLHDVLAHEKKKEIELLEQKEVLLIKKLEKNQNAQENISHEFEDILKTPAELIEIKYKDKLKKKKRRKEKSIA